MRKVAAVCFMGDDRKIISDLVAHTIVNNYGVNM